ncbi:RDD family protein [Ornithinibacillus sp. BX22]|uniref:RDD family protein n=1 Tax=Ornithinibacillus hominis TaxID=2763055 RepID=A0A923L2X4_9BACI|nr:RDD family protein [Ornithinibacillus hominis]MBC5635504.1 RDD family protein [Ornithinibacillus hominis]
MNQGQVEIKTPQFVSLQYQVAGLGSRAAAMLIDQALIMVTNLLIYLIFITANLSDMFYFSDSWLPIAIAITIVFVINWGYFFFAEYFFSGKTLGKKWLGIRAIQENGHSLTLLSSLIRNLLRIIDMLPTGYFVGMMFVFFHSKHKRLGDIVAGTIVVHERGVKKERTSRIDKEIARRGLTKDSLQLEDWALRAIGNKEWELLRAYSRKFLNVSVVQRAQLTNHLAEKLLPRLGIAIDGKPITERENILLTLYVIAREEWEYELS